MYAYRGQVINVVDGGTFDVVVDLGCDVSHKTRVRLLGVDVPETKAAREFAKHHLLYRTVVVRSESEDVPIKVGGFRWWLASLTLEDGTDFAWFLVRNGYGVPYERRQGDV